MAKPDEGRPADEEPSTQSRRLLSKLRALWDAHSPSSPMFLGEEVAPGLTVSSFCVELLVSQRSRRMTKYVAGEATSARRGKLVDVVETLEHEDVREEQGSEQPLADEGEHLEA